MTGALAYVNCPVILSLAFLWIEAYIIKACALSVVVTLFDGVASNVYMGKHIGRLQPG
jgi:hypothetical protein